MERGGLVDGAQSLVNTVTVFTGHQLAIGDKFLYALSVDNISMERVFTITNVVTNAITFSGDAFSFPDESILVNLGADTGGLQRADLTWEPPNYDASLDISSDPELSTTFKALTVPPNKEIGFWIDDTLVPFWALIVDGGTKAYRVFMDLGSSPSGETADEQGAPIGLNPIQIQPDELGWWLIAQDLIEGTGGNSVYAADARVDSWQPRVGLGSYDDFGGGLGPQLKSAQINSRAAVLMVNGDVDDALDSSGYDQAGAYTFGAVYMATSALNGGRIIGTTAGSSNIGISVPEETATAVAYVDYSAAGATAITASFDNTAGPISPWHICIIRRNADDEHDILHDGSDITLGTPTVSGSMIAQGLFRHQANAFMAAGWMCAEMALWSTNISDDERESLYNFWANRFGSTVI
jgi:hypothetical protein